MTTASIPAWRDQIAQLRYLAAKVGRVHGPTHPDMATLAEVVATLADSPADDRAAHAALGRRMRELTADFRPWSGSCASVYQLYQGLSAVTAALPATPSEHA
jgi:iron-sulfur cluster repair protein YtfE (RIC family)